MAPTTPPRCPYCGRLKLQDTYAGAGGAGRGYSIAGFCVDAVDNSAARLMLYPSDCPGATRRVGDAIKAILASTGLYAARHTSPPCTGYTRGTAAIPDRLTKYDRLIAATREALQIVTAEEGRDTPWIIENVEDAKRELRSPLMICWTHLHRPGSVVDHDGTPLWMKRHRLFESNIDLWPAGECDHPKGMQCAGAYGGARRDKWEAKHIRKGGYVPSLDVMQALLGTPWMTNETACKLSIPPAYTEHLGRQVRDTLDTLDVRP